MPAKLSGRIRYEKRLYTMKNPKRIVLEELACEAESLETKNEKLVDCLDAITKVLNIRFGIGWIEQEFNASNYDACDSINASDDIAHIIQSASEFALERKGTE